MKNLAPVPAATVNGRTIEWRDVLDHAFWHEDLGFLERAIDAEIVREAVAARGIGASPEEVEAAANAFRTRRGLFEAAAMRRWLVANGRTAAEWESYLRDGIERRKLRESLFAAAVQSHFDEHRDDFEQAAFSRLLVADEATAEELWRRIHEESADFHALARAYSIDAATAPMGGYAGHVTRGEVTPIVAAALFGARTGEVIGPIAAQGGWLLVMIEDHLPATLTSERRERIVEDLFAAWLAAQRRKAAITRPLLEPRIGSARPDGDSPRARRRVPRQSDPRAPEARIRLAHEEERLP